MSDPKAKELIGEYESLKAERSIWERTWQNIEDYVFPMREFQIERVPGEFRYRKNFDSEVANTLDEFASNIHGLLVNPALKWFKLKFMDENLNRNREYMMWLESREDVMYAIINSDRFNFNTQMHEVFLDEGAFGTSGLFLRDTMDGAALNYVNLNELVIDEDDAGNVDKVYRPFEMSGHRALKRWGEKLPEKLQEKARKEPGCRLKFLHAVKERDRVPGMTGKQKKFGSWWVSLDEEAVFDEGGFDRFPYIVPRFSKAQGEIYGRSPAMKAFPNVLVCNSMTRSLLRTLQKVADPILKAKHDDVVSAIRTAPASVIYVRNMDSVQPLLTGGRPDVGDQFLKDRQEAVRRAFYLHLFAVPQSDRMTAVEFQGRLQMQLQQLSPQVSRFQSEGLIKVINVLFDIVMRDRSLPKPPKEIQGADLDVEFVSPLALAQKASDVSNIQQWIGAIAPLVQFDPMILQNMNLDDAAQFISRRLSVPQMLMRPSEDLEKMRSEISQSQQSHDMLDQIQKGAKAAKDASASGVA